MADSSETVATVRKLILCWRCNGPARLTGVRVRLSTEGGGHEAEGEDIEVLEMPLDAALAMIENSEIVDMKTIMLLQAAKLSAS